MSFIHVSYLLSVPPRAHDKSKVVGGGARAPLCPMVSAPMRVKQQRNGIADDAYNSAYHQCSDDGGLVTAHSRFWRENNCSCNRATSLGMYM